jgi:Xaa-Pro aminopeptidase
MELITDWEKIEDRVGLSIPRHTLYSTVCLDAPKDLSAVLVKGDEEGYYLLARLIEHGNFAAGGRSQKVVEGAKIEVIYYKPYFSWEKSKENLRMPADEGEALAKICGEGSSIKVDGDMPLERFQRLASRFDAKVNPWAEPDNFEIYEMDKDEVIRLFAKGLRGARKIASDLIDSLTSNSKGDKDLIKERMHEGQDKRFEQLNDLMRKSNIGAIVATSQLNIQELAAIPWDSITDGMFAIYNGKQIFVVSPKKLRLDHPRKTESSEKLGVILRKLAGQGVVGIEEKHIPVQTYNSIQSEKEAAGTLLRLWRERRGESILPYYIIAAQAARYSIENALKFLDEQIKDGAMITENDVDSKLEELIREFKEKYEIPMELRKFFIVLHAGTRTPYPSLPADFRLDPTVNSVKIDSGVLVFENGLYHGCSDLCRTLAFTDEGREMFSLLDDAMVQSAIPACREGLTGADVHRKGLEPLIEKAQKIRELGMIPEDASIENFNRDIGHLLGKQEPTTIFFNPTETGSMTEAGMVGCVEYQWPYKAHALGTEDMFLILKDRAINITR